MKKFLVLILALLLISLASCAGKTDPIIAEGVDDVIDYVHEVTGEAGKVSFEYGITETNTIMITGYTGSYGKHAVTVPAEIGGINVTEIAPKAFYYDNSITSVIIPDSVKLIGAWAFAGCSYLETVELPQSLTHIDDGAFYLCTAIDQLTLSTSLNSIGKYVFYGCDSLAEIDIPETVTEIGDSAFWECASLVKVTGMEGVQTIGSYVFNGCLLLTDIEIPSLTEEIGEHAFNACEVVLIKVISGSYAETYASAYGYNFTK